MTNAPFLSRVLPSVFPYPWPTVDFNETRKRSRILVIDDSEFPYLVLFQRDGYTIEKWDDVVDLSKLENGYYDLILLDIQNVGKSISNEQGLGVLKHIHESNPAQIVVAYSNSDWSLKYQDFFALADARLAKTEDYVVFKRCVDGLLNKRFSIDFYVDRICSLAKIPDADEAKVRKKIKKAILQRSPDALDSLLPTLSEHKDTLKLTMKTATAAMTLLATLLGS